MANEFLYKAVTNVGNLIYTAAREDTDGKPTTRVEFKDPQPMVLSGSIVTDTTFHDAVTTAGYGYFAVGTNKTLTIEISGTSTARTILFECSSVSGAYYPIQGVKLQDFAMATQTTGNNELWQFDVTGLQVFRVRVYSVSGGNVSVKGKAVA